MLRRQQNENSTFAATVEYNMVSMESALKQRRKNIPGEWSHLDQGWEQLQDAMLDAGIACSTNPKQTVRLNVGGSLEYVKRRELEGAGFPSAKWAQPNLFTVQWGEQRIPRDANGDFVIDESPACVRYLLNTMKPNQRLGGELDEHDKPYLPHVSRALGLSAPLPDPAQTGMVVAGGTFHKTLLEEPFRRPRQAPDGESVTDKSRFGDKIARTLEAEHEALRDAQDELIEAGTKAAASVNALLGVYRPQVARGDEDSVVELSVNGVKMTTLRSTLQACPGSQLASYFSRENWPGQGTNGQAQREIACSPSVFSKVLDVLRMRKRCGWTGHQTVRVRIKLEDRASFEHFVHRHFSGCESFIMDCVEPVEEEVVVV